MSNDLAKSICRISELLAASWCAFVVMFGFVTFAIFCTKVFQ